MTTQRLILTPGEPAGIGPDLVIQAAQETWPAELIVIADPMLLIERAQQLKQPLQLTPVAFNQPPAPHQPGTLKIIPLTLSVPVIPGQLNMQNAAYVMQTLTQAVHYAKRSPTLALVTGPVHKGILNQAGFDFIGHTEFFETAFQAKQAVMLFVADTLKVALATTHLPLKAVSQAITKERLHHLLVVLKNDLQKYFGLSNPRILVAGLNPHAGEGGVLGDEEITTIIPVIQSLQQQGWSIEGPFAADTLFTQKRLGNADVVLAMYHDQALPAIKYLHFGKMVNVTLGLPCLRTSVDHGVALDIAGTGRADAHSFKRAIQLASTTSRHTEKMSNVN